MKRGWHSARSASLLFLLDWCSALHCPLQRTALPVAARCVGLRSALRFMSVPSVAVISSASCKVVAAPARPCLPATERSGACCPKPVDVIGHKTMGDAAGWVLCWEIGRILHARQGYYACRSGERASVCLLLAVFYG